MPLPEPPIEFAGTMSCSTAAAMPCSSTIDMSDLLDSVAFPVPVSNVGHEFDDLLAVCAADVDQPPRASVAATVAGAAVAEEPSVQVNLSESVEVQDLLSSVSSVSITTTSCRFWTAW